MLLYSTGCLKIHAIHPRFRTAADYHRVIAKIELDGLCMESERDETGKGRGKAGLQLLTLTTE